MKQTTGHNLVQRSDPPFNTWTDMFHITDKRLWNLCTAHHIQHKIVRFSVINAQNFPTVVKRDMARSDKRLGKKWRVLCTKDHTGLVDSSTRQHVESRDWIKQYINTQWKPESTVSSFKFTQHISYSTRWPLYRHCEIPDNPQHSAHVKWYSYHASTNWMLLNTQICN